jgi:translation initiation factor 2 gamma subunit (eIF-2gamma)
MKITKDLAGIVLPMVAMYLIKSGAMIIYQNRIKLIKKDRSRINAKKPEIFDPATISSEHMIMQSSDELLSVDTISCEE